MGRGGPVLTTRSITKQGNNMRSHTVIAGQSGQRVVTSTTERLHIKAAQIEPGDWLMKQGARTLHRDRPVLSVQSNGAFIVVKTPLHGSVTLPADQMVTVERTK